MSRGEGNGGALCLRYNLDEAIKAHDDAFWTFQKSLPLLTPTKPVVYLVIPLTAEKEASQFTFPPTEPWPPCTAVRSADPT